ncbi:hypothetical protein IU433_26760 [Nocardia puris]|uniref:hypothetical protein n=1 Tax=Nocardia puris TaxID=208602 RepID=UPI001894792A|nr:hypothetical protein [Nocardia puris]MBF6367984.1 hypothetical protein [Nocardia puris]MBF6462617.1 hypothetical protein [Nocardia puris]
MGIACIVAAIIGGGVSLFGHELPVINNKWRQLGLATVGALLIAPTIYAYFYGGFKVRNIEVSWDSGHLTRSCDGHLRYTMVIETSAAGTYQLRPVVNGIRAVELHTYEAGSAGSHTLAGLVEFDAAPGQKRTHSIFVEALSPNQVVSSTKYIDTWC